MKNKTITAIFVLITLVALTAAGCTVRTEQNADGSSKSNAPSSAGNNTDEVSSKNTLETVKALSPDEIKSVEFIFYTEGGASGEKITDKDEIATIHSLICEIILGQPTQMGADDDGLNIQVITEKQTYTLSFESHILVSDGETRNDTENLSPLKRYLRELTESN